MKMNETMKRSPLVRRLALLLCIALMLGALATMLSACSPNVMALDGVAIDREMYAFWFSMSKTDVMRRYGIKSAQDNEAFWSSTCGLEGKEGKTWGEVVTDDINRAIKQKLAAALLYDELELSMTKPQKNKIKSYLDDMISYVSNGDKGDLRDELDLYGSSFSALRRCAAFDLKAALVLSYLARNGKTMLTSEEKNGFYADNYYRVKIVYINNSVYGRFENGVRVETELSFTGPGAYNDADKQLMADILDGYYDTGKLPEDFEETFATLLARSDEEIHGSEAYPDGIYHAHPEHHNIKKEGIGLIEAMGRFILPGRLKTQLAAIADILTGKTPYDPAAIADEGHPLNVHAAMIATLVAEHGTALGGEEATAAVRTFVNRTCASILGDTAVFKRTPEGLAAFDAFVAKI